MVTTGAIIHGKGDYLLAGSEEEHPQLGGSDSPGRALCKAGAARGYDEINSTGCPPIVQMVCRRLFDKYAQLVADCVKSHA